MVERGITREEIERTLNEGWAALDAKPGMGGKVFVFRYDAEWEDEFFEEKEVTVYYKMVGEAIGALDIFAEAGDHQSLMMLHALAGYVLARNK